MRNKKIRLIFFSYRPYLNATSRYRVYKIVEKINNNKFSYKIYNPFSNRSYIKLINSKNLFVFLIIQVITLFRRIFQLIFVRNNQIIIIQRELLRIGPPILEKIISKINPNIIYDIDDADFHMRGIFYDHKKIQKIMKLSRIIFVGNQYLGDYAKNYCRIVKIIPTLIDTGRYKIRDLKTYKKSSKYILGWVGTPRSLENLKLIVKPIKILSKKFPIELNIISNKIIELGNIPIRFTKWTLKEEISNLNTIDIGIMPLYDNPYNRGKCGFKLLQYMALGIPTVASPVGVNKQIIKHGENGLLAYNSKEWIKSIQILIENYNIYKKIHANSITKVFESYSFNKFIPIIEDLLEKFYILIISQKDHKK